MHKNFTLHYFVLALSGALVCFPCVDKISAQPTTTSYQQPGNPNPPTQNPTIQRQVPLRRMPPAYRYQQRMNLQEQQAQNQLFYEQNAFRDAIERQRAIQRQLDDDSYPYSNAGPTYYESPLESGERR